MQGLVLTAIGMGMVFIFLFILIAMMNNLERIVTAVSRIIPSGEQKAVALKADMTEIAAAVFIATRLATRLDRQQA